jgi:hypothetical protein
VPTNPLSSLTGDSWWRVLLVGIFAWVGSATAAVFTRDPVLLPGVFIVGSFLVPFALLGWLLERSTRQWLEGGHQDVIVPYRLLLAFAAASATSRLHLTRSVIGWLSVAIVLHAGWDLSTAVAAWLVAAWNEQSLTSTEFRGEDAHSGSAVAQTPNH